MTRRILVPVDGSTQSNRALTFALENYPDDDLIVLTIIDPVEAVYATDFETAPTFDAPMERAAQILENAESKAEDVDRDVETLTRTGKPAREIVRVADEKEVDHIVLGSYGRSGISRILLGSVAEAVVRRASVPVTVVR